MIDHSTPADAQAVLAANIRRLRVARHMSLSELARATGIGKATLSAVENGRANPTVSTLTALADPLGVSAGELLEEPALGEIRVVRAGQGTREGRDGVEERVIGTVQVAGPARLRELALPARHVHRSGAGDPGAREELLVLQGKLIAGPAERITELAVGDYASFPADVPRVYETGRQAARALVVSH